MGAASLLSDITSVGGTFSMLTTRQFERTEKWTTKKKKKENKNNGEVVSKRRGKQYSRFTRKKAQ